MPRIARKDINTMYNHIIVQGIGKEYIFENDDNKEKYLELIFKNIKNNSKVKLLSYCVMGNHAHMLFYSEKIYDVSKLMQRVNTKYAKYYNELKERVGFVFRNRFFLQPITSRRQLHNCIIYIHNNPVKAFIANSPEKYKYSSYNEWLKQAGMIDDEVCELVYNGKIKNIEKFIFAHKENDIQDIIDIEEFEKNRKEIAYNTIIARYEKKYSNKLNSLVKDNDILFLIVTELKNEAKMSVREISKLLNINRPKITKILNK